MNIRPVKLAAVLAALCLMAVACISSDDNSDAAVGGSATEGGTNTETSKAVAGVEEATAGQVTTIKIESWRPEDAVIWETDIIPAFEAQFPDINVEFAPTDPTQYDAVLESRLAAGAAGDVIACRPFDASLTLFERGHLAPLTELAAMEHFSPAARAAWTTDDRGTPYCVPLAAVIHGFIYNKTAFSELGLREPQTEEEFFALLGAIRDDGRYVPLAIGTHDRWESATMGFQNIGPNHWKGEQGRLALIDGTAKLSDQAYVDTLAVLQRWSAYLGDDVSSVTYADAQAMFASGAAAIYPAGSWEIAAFNAAADFELGAFGPPPPADQDACYISDHSDMGLGMNAEARHPQAAMTFLRWAASSEFADIFSNALPGFFSLHSTPVTLTDPLAQEFASWRGPCESTIRNSAQILSRGEPNLEQELWEISARVLNGSMDPAEGARRLQAGLDAWYTPAG